MQKRYLQVGYLNVVLRRECCEEKSRRFLDTSFFLGHVPFVENEYVLIYGWTPSGLLALCDVFFSTLPTNQSYPSDMM